MEIAYIRIAFFLISAACVLWGALIVFSEKYFSYWQNRYWKERNDGQWSETSIKANRLGTGLGSLIFGLALAYFALFQMQQV